MYLIYLLDVGLITWRLFHLISTLLLVLCLGGLSFLRNFRVAPAHAVLKNRHISGRELSLLRKVLASIEKHSL